jgi:amidase
MISTGRTSAEAVVQACLDRIAERDPDVHAWAFIDPSQALEQARRLDRSESFGPLHGVPIAVKDIIDTCDMPTSMGSPIYAGFQPRGDAACVALVRNAGAVILGKTVTAEFASSAPGPTVNPHNHRHTPGGSSSGSAAAVADYMVPVAFGTQTGGSVLRPSAYCGIIGYRPTFGMFNMTGVKPAAQSLDTLGLHARSLDDIELLTAVLVGRDRPVKALWPDRRCAGYAQV